MTNTQKLIKYLAFAFAIVLIINIFSGLFFVGTAVLGIFSHNEKANDNFITTEISETSKILDVEIAASKLLVKTGDQLKVDNNNKYINVEEKDNKIIIKEKNHNFLNVKNSEIIVYIPEDMVFDAVKLSTGAGKIDIETLNTDVLNLDLGAGEITIDNLYVNKAADIESGAGKTTIKNGEINNLDLDAGIGKLTLTSALKGTSDIDAGIGELNINLIGSKDDYTIVASKGVGDFKIAGESFVNKSTFGNGINKIDIDGGIGSINVKFVEN